MSDILDASFEPKAVHDHFIELTKLYHPSGEEDKVREYVIQFAEKIEGVEVVFYEPDAKDPGKRVIVLRRKGSGNRVSAPFVTLQAHMDMVCSPNKDIFPLHVFGYLDKEGAKWIKAGDEESVFYPEKGTTLGADAGIGVATILALLEDEKLKDYPIECFFTVQEETDMRGAADFDKNLLKGRNYIDFEAGREEIIIYGSAGGCTVQFEGNAILSSIPYDFIIMELSISGLRGGHSGVNINSIRLNAIKVLTEILIRLNNRLTKLYIEGEGIKSYDLRLISFQRDEDPILNKIPSCASSIIAIPSGNKVEFVRDFKAYCETLKIQSQPEENLDAEIREVTKEVTLKSFDETSTDALLCLLRQIPHGVIRMIPTIPNLVETSSNLANIMIKPEEDISVNGNVVIEVLNRSSDSDLMNTLIRLQETIGELYEYTVKTSDAYPSWKPNGNSVLLDKATDIYKELSGNGFKPTVVHAGFECSYIVQKYNNEIDCIAIGPTVVNLHSGGESLKAASVEKFYMAVTSLIQSLF